MLWMCAQLSTHTLKIIATPPLTQCTAQQRGCILSYSRFVCILSYSRFGHQRGQPASSGLPPPPSEDDAPPSLFFIATPRPTQRRSRRRGFY